MASSGYGYTGRHKATTDVGGSDPIRSRRNFAIHWRIAGGQGRLTSCHSVQRGCWKLNSARSEAHSSGGRIRWRSETERRRIGRIGT